MNDKRFDTYLDFFQSISPQTIGQLEKICRPDVRFKDPFNDVRSVKDYQKILTHMYSQVEEPSFIILDKAFSGDHCYAKWKFSFIKDRRQNSFIGMSEIIADDAGKIIAHIDYWDTGEHIYSKIPVLGGIIRFIRKKLSIE